MNEALTDLDEPRVVAIGRDEAKRLYLRVETQFGGKWQRLLIPHDAVAESATRILGKQLGLHLAPSRNRFLTEIEAAIRRRPSFRVLSRPGLHGDHFVLPGGGALGPGPLPDICLPEVHPNVQHRFARSGDRTWLQCARFAIGNSRMQLAVAVGCCGPVLELLPDLEIPFVQLVGSKGGGKSTILRLVSSMWGLPLPFIWSQTVNAMERVAGNLSGTVLVMDELGTFEWDKPKARETFRGAVMRFFEGQGRGRLGEGADHWRLALLSSSNMYLRDLPAGTTTSDRAAHDAMVSRILEVCDPPGDHGVYEDLHGYATVEDASAFLRMMTETHHGRFGPELVRRMLAQPREQLVRLLRDWRAVYVKERRARIPAVAGDPVSARVTQIFATIYAAGRLAIYLRLLPWDGREFGRAILGCERAHRELSHTAADPAAIGPIDPLEAVRRYVVTERGGRVVDLRGGNNSAEDGCLDDGYVIHPHAGRPEFFVSSGGLDRICGSRSRALQLKRQLKHADGAFGDEHRISSRRPVMPGQPRSQGIAIPLVLLGSDAP